MVAVNDVVVLAIAVPGVAKLSVDDSHRVIVPVLPLNVKRVELVPVQTVELPAMDPPTEAGETDTVAIALLASAQAALEMTAL